MCIALISTSHPKYPFILINNRDEFISRPTAQADWWKEPNQHVLGGRDLQREIQGTWLGITKQGRIAVLTNFREEGQDFSGLKSRGGIVNSFLTTPPDSTETPEDFARRLVEDVGVSDVGGFSLVFGRLRAPKDGKHDGLAIVSNRTPDAHGVVWIATESNQYHGLSNSHYGDLSWPKVVHGELLLKQALHSNASRDAGKQDLISRLFDILSIDTLPKQKEGEAWDAYIRQLRNSIFIPKVGGSNSNVKAQSADEIAAASSEQPVSTSNGAYATQKQTVILVDMQGHVTFIEKTLYDHNEDPSAAADQTMTFEFDIEGWQ